MNAMPEWRLSRFRYACALGALTVVGVQLKTPLMGLLGYALFAVVTALRFRSLKWNLPRAFLPLGIATVGTLLALVKGAPPGIAAQSHAVAFFTQVWNSLHAGLSYGPHDAIPRNVVLARDLREKRRALLDAMRISKPYGEASSVESAAIIALYEELKARYATHGASPSPEIDDIQVRIATQKAVLDQRRIDGSDAMEKTRVATEELSAARQAWKDRNQREQA